MFGLCYWWFFGKPIVEVRYIKPHTDFRDFLGYCSVIERYHMRGSDADQHDCDSVANEGISWLLKHCAPSIFSLCWVFDDFLFLRLVFCIPFHVRSPSSCRVVWRIPRSRSFPQNAATDRIRSRFTFPLINHFNISCWWCGRMCFHYLPPRNTSSETQSNLREEIVQSTWRKVWKKAFLKEVFFLFVKCTLIQSA